jgi:DNA-binding transcriptional regulator YdaS (Cro superfamily)
MDSYTQAFAEAIKTAGMRNDYIALKTGVSSNQVSQWRRGRRPIPAQYAPHLGSLLTVAPEQISVAYARLVDAGVMAEARDMPVPKAHVRIPRLPDFGRPDALDDCFLLDFVARRKLGATPIEDARWTLQPSQALAPQIERDALVLVDARATGQSDVVDGAMYAFTLWGRPDIRRILVRRDHWLLVGQSSDTGRTEVYEADLPHLRLFGMVVGWL